MRIKYRKAQQSPNTVQKYRKELGLRAVLAVRAPYITKGHKEHPIYSYKLKGLDEPLPTGEAL